MNEKQVSFGKTPRTTRAIQQRFMDRLRGENDDTTAGVPRRRRPTTPAANASIEEARKRMARARGSAFSPEDRKLLSELTEALRANTATLREVYDLGPQEGQEPASAAEAEEDDVEDSENDDAAEEAAEAVEEDDDSPAEDAT